MEFKHEEGKIYCRFFNGGDWVDVTEDVMPVVDDYLDYKLDLKFGTEFSKAVKRV